jgi:hypothetical protein
VDKRALNSPLRHIHQIIPLRPLDKARYAEPARLLLLALAVVGRDYVAYKRAVAGDGDLFRGVAEAADDCHARELRGAGRREGACGGRRADRGGRGAEEEGHFDRVIKVW